MDKVLFFILSRETKQNYEKTRPMSALEQGQEQELALTARYWQEQGQEQILALATECCVNKEEIRIGNKLL